MYFGYVEGAAGIVSAAITGSIPYLILHVTSACNARCRMCFNWDGMKARHNPKGIQVEDMERLATSMRPLPQLTCSGGEPLLREDLPKILEAFYRNARTRFFTVPTNSLLPDRVAALIESFTKNCPNGFLNICLPFHGTQGEFDDILGVPGAFEKFNQTYAVIKEVQKKNKRISFLLNFVMSKFNAENYKDIIDTALEHYPEAPLGIAYARGLPKEREAVEIPLDVFQQAHEYLNARRKNRNRFNPYSVMFSAIGKQMADTVTDVIRGDRKNLKCRAGRRFIVIYEDGKVYPCELLDVVGIPDNADADAPSEALLGDLKEHDYNMKLLLRSDKAQHTMKWIDDHGCACTWECAIYSRLTHSPADLLRVGANAVTYIMKSSG